MSNISGFFTMGGYAFFVWPAYGITLAVLGGLAVQSWQRYRESTAVLELLQQEGRKRR
jgi:heme exporter protein D